MAFAVLIVPTSLMGATLPLVVKASSFRSSSLGSQLGLLYASNAAGAIVGTIAAGLYLIPQRGIHGTFLTAAALNLFVGLGAIVMSVRSAGLSATPGDVRLKPDARGPSSPRIILVVFTISGAVSLALEVVWFRVLTLFLRPTVYGFAVMLAMILVGISAGSFLVTPLLNRRLRWLEVLAGLELAIGIAIVLSFRPLVYLPSLSDTLTPLVAPFMPEYLGYPITGALLAIFPVALLMGLAFPIGLHTWAAGGRRDDHTAGRIGLFYSLNVAGAIAGSIVAGFLHAAAARERHVARRARIAQFCGRPRAARRVRPVTAGARGVRAAGVGDLCRVGLVVARPVRPVCRTALPGTGHRLAGGRRRGDGCRSREPQRGADPHHQREPSGEHRTSRRRTCTGGSATSRWRSIPDPVPRSSSASEAARRPEPSASTTASTWTSSSWPDRSCGAPGFSSRINYGVLSRPNVHLRVDDGRNYLMLTPRRYDVITADVIHPIFAGSGNLYSVEYFRQMRRVLNPGGLVLQWVAGTEAEYKTIARTFLSVFPGTTAWVAGGLLVGSVEPLRLRRSDFEWKLKQPGSSAGPARSERRKLRRPAGCLHGRSRGTRRVRRTGGCAHRTTGRSSSISSACPAITTSIWRLSRATSTASSCPEKPGQIGPRRAVSGSPNASGASVDTSVRRRPHVEASDRVGLFAPSRSA